MKTYHPMERKLISLMIKIARWEEREKEARAMLRVLRSKKRKIDSEITYVGRRVS